MLRFPYRQVFGDPDNQRGQQFYDLDTFKRHRRARDLEGHGEDQPGAVMATTNEWRRQAVAKKAAAHADRRARHRAPTSIREAVRGKRFLAADRAALDLGEIATWDRYLLREQPPARADRRAGAVRAAERHRADGAAADARRRRRRRRRHRPRRRPARPVRRRPAAPRRRAPALGDARRAAARHASTQTRRRRHQPARAAGAARPLGGAAHRAAARARPSRSSPAGCSRPTAPWRCRWRSGPKAMPRLGGARRGRRADPAQGAHRHRRRLASRWSGVYDAVLNRFAFHDPLADLADASRRKAWTATAPPTSWPAGGAMPRSTRSTRRAATTACTSCSSACAGACCTSGATRAPAARSRKQQDELRRALGLHERHALVGHAAGRSPASRAAARRSAVRAGGQDARRRPTR